VKVMKANGSMVSLKAKESNTYRMVQFSTECGRKVCLKELEYVNTLMALFLMEIGKKVNHMVWAKKLYQMVLHLMDVGSKVKQEVMELKYYQMVLSLKVNGKKVVFFQASVSFQMARFTMVNGMMENLKVSVLKYGLMVEDMKEIGFKENLSEKV